MANIEQGLRRLSKHRYSIRQLLALSGNAYASFDLSKFSFDAARAGVVPTLDDCGMASRRTSITRHRISSTETANIAEQSIERSEMSYQHPERTHIPERRPQPPPVSLLAQQNTGFAKFLKKHTSPTHQRVTAGGRIVPMEARQAPPPFILGDTETTKSAEAFSKIEHKQPVPQSCAVDVVTHHPNSPNHDRGPRIGPASTLNQLHLDNDTPCHYGLRKAEWPAQPYINIHPDVGHGGMMNSHNLMSSAIEFGASSCASFVPGFNLAHSSWQNMYGLSSTNEFPTIGVWPYTGGMQVPQEQNHNATVGHLIQPIIWAQNALADWNQRYIELDQQLKALDRHRAMTTLTSEIAIQRREIVQQRFDSKNMINLISKWLEMSQQVHPGTNGGSVTPTFNADAPAYIPAAQKAPNDLPGTIYANDITAVTQNGHVARQAPRQTRRPIAIVPPPKVETNISPARRRDTTSPESPERDNVDPWGVKIGPAPPELRRQQSEILESISEAQSQSSVSNNSRESLQSVPQGGFFQKDTVNRPRDISSHRCSLLDPCISVPNAQVHPSLENVYAATSNNLRRPADTLAMLENSFGNPLDWESKQMQCSRNNDPSWIKEIAATQKLLPVDAIVHERVMASPRFAKSGAETPTNQLISVDEQAHSKETHPPPEDRKENISIRPVVHQKAATDIILQAHNRSETQDWLWYSGNEQSPFQKRAMVVHEREQLLAENKYDQESDFRLGAERLEGRNGKWDQVHRTSDTYGSMLDASRVLPHAVSRSCASRNTVSSTEPLSNKGYSSTSVQNVNVVAHLPQNLDGTADSSKGSRSMFSLVGKVKSPRLLRRTVANGGA